MNLPSQLCDLPSHQVSQVLRIQYQKELAQAHVTVQTKFNYAWGLVKSPMREHQVEGVRLLQGVCSIVIFDCFALKWHPCPEIYRAEASRRRECLYYLSLGHYKMGNYDEAKKFNGPCFQNIVALLSDVFA